MSITTQLRKLSFLLVLSCSINILKLIFRKMPFKSKKTQGPGSSKGEDSNALNPYCGPPPPDRAERRRAERARRIRPQLIAQIMMARTSLLYATISAVVSETFSGRTKSATEKGNVDSKGEDGNGQNKSNLASSSMDVSVKPKPKGRFKSLRKMRLPKFMDRFRKRLKGDQRKGLGQSKQHLLEPEDDSDSEEILQAQSKPMKK